MQAAIRHSIPEFGISFLYAILKHINIRLPVKTKLKQLFHIFVRYSVPECLNIINVIVFR